MTDESARMAASNPEVVSFYRMEDGTREDYALLDRAERRYVQALPDGCWPRWANWIRPCKGIL